MKSRLHLFIVILLLAFISLSCTKKVEFNNPFDPSVSLAPPTNLRVASVTDSSLLFQWSDHYIIRSEAQTSIASIMFEGSFDDTVFSVIDTFSATDTTGIVSTKFDTTSQTQYFRIFAKIGERTSTTSNVVAWIKSSINPFGLSLTSVSEYGRTLNWRESSSLVEKFQIERKAGTIGSFDVIGVTPPSVTNFLDTAIILTNTTYYYRVCAILRGGLKSLYDTASIYISFPPPSNLMMSASDSSSISLTWSDNFTGLVGSEIQRGEDSITFVTVGTVGPGITKFTDIGLDRSKMYYYRLRNFTQYNKSPYSASIRIFYGCDSLHQLTTLPFSVPVSAGYTFGSIYVSRQGNVAMFWSKDGTITVWDVVSRLILHTFSQLGTIGRVGLSGNGAVLGIMDSSAGSFSLYSTTDGHLVREITIAPPAVDLEMSNDGLSLITSGGDDTIRVWNVERGSVIASMTGIQKSPTSLFLTEGGDTLVSGGGNTLCFWDLHSGSLLQTTSGGYFNKPIYRLANGNWVGANFDDSGVRVFGLSTGATILTIPTRLSDLSYTSWFLSPDGATLFAGGSDGFTAYNLIPAPPVAAGFADYPATWIIARMGESSKFIAKDELNYYGGAPIIFEMKFDWITQTSGFNGGFR
ncbi:MAG TPA: hypothetical protein VLX91_04460 [Candidatus Acidoferrales bacterium]|nr:hypothetical protein [Candidatus Acidoferrales bacterium]